MISRLCAVTAIFAVLAAASLTFAADLPLGASATRAAATKAQVIQLERVVITAKGMPAESR